MKKENRIFLVLVALVLIGLWILGVTTPDECKVAVEEMSSWCKDVRFP